MPTCRTGHHSTHSLTQLLFVRSQIDGLHALRSTTLTQSDYNQVERHALLRVNTQNIAVKHRADLPTTAPLLGNSTTHTR